VIGAKRDEGASRDDVTEEQRCPGPKMDLPLGPGGFWAAPALLLAFISPGMRALRSLARSQIVLANCTGYVLTDPNSQMDYQRVLFMKYFNSCMIPATLYMS